MAAMNILLALLVISVTVYVFTFHFDSTTGAELYALPLISFLSLSGAVVTVLLLRPMSIQSSRLTQTEASIEDLSKLNNTLREQRHDFMNHLQVVHSLIELDEHSEANSYIEKVYQSIEKVSSAMKTGIPAVNAILEAKRQAAENRGVDVTIKINTSLSDMPVPDWELCKLLGNIIDNALNSLSEFEGKVGKHLSIEMFEDIHSYKFRISNNGPLIPQELWDRIFETGFTTRVRDGEGMGLAICSDIIRRYRGKLWVISDEYETVFEGFVPRQ